MPPLKYRCNLRVHGVDYGSGMELYFLCWLGARRHIVQAGFPGLVVEIRHRRYIQAIPLLQSAYWLEPAGSHGAWGLDDFHFLSFLFGSARLRGNEYPCPKAIEVHELANDYTYSDLSILSVSIPITSLPWHSTMADDIPTVKTRRMVNAGMIRMYKAEVLGKLPVVHYIPFGSILPYDPPLPSKTADERTHGEHVHEGWCDCCRKVLLPLPRKGREGRRLKALEYDQSHLIDMVKRNGVECR
ncbi:hypothetical protein EV401DRAFT_1851020 [Pisolithus croceorrhizus]|nr:hypothetical protein EV401DRAFT_1851020 [Pisolithus croceorrhizus]